MNNRKVWVSMLLVCLVIFGGIAFMKFSGVTEAVNAQNEVKDKGFYYTGDVWLTPDSYNSLSNSLAQRDPSLQTRSDLTILPETNSGKLHIKYSFFSTDNYTSYGLTTAEIPSWYNQGSALANVAYILIPITIILFAFRILEKA